MADTLSSPLYSVSSPTDGPIWQMTLQQLTFDMPFTREKIVLGSSVTSFLTWGSAILYFLLVTQVFPYIKPSQSFKAKFSKIHYTLLCLYSLIACTSTIYLIISRGEYNNWDLFFCNEVPDWYQLLNISFTFSKYWEWLDTLILVWNGQSLQDIGFLHFYHHMTTVWLFSFTMSLPGTAKIGLLLNGFVHTIMYYHFAYRLPRFARPLITFAQIVQLAVGTWSHYPNVTTCSRSYNIISDYPFTFLVPYLFVPVYLIFFIRFFVESYICPSKRSPRREKKNDTTTTSSTDTTSVDTTTQTKKHTKKD